MKCPVQAAKYAAEVDNPPSPPSGKEESGGSVKPPQLILVRLMSDHCTISIDSSGELLHRRGYRLVTGKAPLRETLAAGMLLASGWDKASPLLDPFCGSGTIPIEAALMAGHIPPGYRRDFAFRDWPSFDRKAWRSLLSDIPQTRLKLPPRIMASDRDAGAIEAARTNAERAGVSDLIEFSCRAVSSVDPPAGSGWVVTNPPYGVRTKGAKDLRNLYAQVGNVLRARCPGWQVTMLCSSIQLLHSTGLEFDRGISLRNGGIKVRLARGTIREG
jgi:putative N6-adenine-specific DNA methylase